MEDALRFHTEDYRIYKIGSWSDWVLHETREERRCRLKHDGIIFSHEAGREFYLPEEGETPDQTHDDSDYADNLASCAEIASSIIIGAHYASVDQRPFPEKLNFVNAEKIYRIGETIRFVTAIMLRVADLRECIRCLSEDNETTDTATPVNILGKTQGNLGSPHSDDTLDRPTDTCTGYSDANVSSAAIMTTIETARAALTEQAFDVLLEIRPDVAGFVIKSHITDFSEEDGRIIDALLQKPDRDQFVVKLSPGQPKPE